jgi:hypothetical protein
MKMSKLVILLALTFIIGFLLGYQIAKYQYQATILSKNQ